MNEKDKNPNYKELYSIVKKLFRKSEHFSHGPFDETYYSMRVYETAKEIIKKIKRKCNKEIILTAAILHDVGKTVIKTEKIFGEKELLPGHKEEWQKHALLSVPIAEKILKEEGRSKEFIEKACYLIKNHDERGKEIKNKSLELKILQDADFIADMGLSGFIRYFLWSGKFKRSIKNQKKYMQENNNSSRRFEKLNLKVSKEIAVKKSEFEKSLTKKLFKEFESDLID